MKYINANRLRKEISHRIDILEDMSIKCAKNDDTEMHAYYHGKAMSLDELLLFIDSLQQGQPSLPDNLEEAAIDFADNARKQLYSKDYAIASIADYDHGCIDGFKAGAEWAIQQFKGKERR